jgi:glycine/D-amino acid oxidase-like deaminating enzyme
MELVGCMMMVPVPPPRKFRIVGGGLAGLGLTYHLLKLAHDQQHQHQQNRERPTGIQIEVLDQHRVGTGGASAVAGGYVDSSGRPAGLQAALFLLRSLVKDYDNIFATLDQAFTSL